MTVVIVIVAILWFIYHDQKSGKPDKENITKAVEPVIPIPIPKIKSSPVGNWRAK